METSEIYKASLDDLVFEGRNKAYGAYLLRKLYNKHVTIATITAIAAFALLLSIPLIIKLLEKEEEVVVTQKIVQVVDLDQPPPIDKNTPPPPPPTELPPPPPLRSTIKFTPPVVKKDADVREQDEIPDQKELNKVDAGVATVKGSDSPAAIDLGDIDGRSDVVGELVEEKPYTYVEQMPTFPGGDAELMKFLAKNIKYPAAAQRAGLEGLVVLSFTVGRDGKISDIQVLKKLGGGTDEEAIRVINLMPNWNAGKQNGRTVPVKFTLPVRFTIK